MRSVDPLAPWRNGGIVFRRCLDVLNLPLRFIPVPRLFGLLASLVAVGVMGWAGPVAAQALRDLPPPGPVASGQRAVADARAPEEYRLGAGDVLRVAVYQNPDLSLESRLSEAGVLNFPLLGPVRLGGLTVGAAEQLIARGLREGQFVRQPQVNVSVVQVRGHQASVLGLVNRPGRFPLEATGLRLTDLLAMAGGAAAGAADVAVVTGIRQGQPWRAEVDLPALFTPGGQGRDVDILHGDTVWVDRQPQVYIYGEVQRPGPLRLERGMTLMQVLATGGGLTPRGTEKGIRVHRRGPDGRLQLVQPAMDDTVREGDVVHVRESLF
jgi:polysaccharide export outer membrane protein